MQSIYFNAEHHQFRQYVRDVIETDLLPYVDQWEQDCCIPKHVWESLGERGLLGLSHKADVNGSDKDIFHSVVWLEELGRTGYGGLRSALAMHSYMATEYLSRYATDELKEIYLAPAVAGKKVSTLAATEVKIGSDLAALSTTVQGHGDDFILNGKKSYIANAAFADFFVMPARSVTQLTGNDISQNSRNTSEVSLFVIDAKWPGVTIEKQNMSSWRCAGMSSITLENVQVPANHLIGRKGKGFAYLMHVFQFERLAAALIALGGAAHSLEHISQFLKERQAYNGNLAQLQSIRHRIADLKTELEATRQLVYHAAWSYQADDWAITECSMAKLAACELSLKIAQQSIQFHGASGCMDDSVTMRALRDGVGTPIAAGASEVMRDIIATQIFG